MQNLIQLLPTLSGLILFLTGMKILVDGLKKLTGSKMKKILQQLTNNPIKSVCAGTVITATIQSSSITTVLTVGFVSAGLLNLSQAIGIIIGANVGTTITAQLIAFDASYLAPFLLLFGFIFSEFISSEKFKNSGYILLGLGLLFVGMGLMKEGTSFLRESESFRNWLADANTPVMGIIMGILFTAVVQSSSATTGVVIVFSSQGLIGLEQGVAIILGSNIGTCITAFLAVIGKPRVALQTAVAHSMFNIIGVLLFLPWIHPFTEAIKAMTEWAFVFLGEEPSAERIIANAHTVFNVLVALLFMPWIGLLRVIIEKWIPDKEKLNPATKLVYIDLERIPEISLGLELIRKEVVCLLEKIQDYVESSMDVVLKKDPAQLKLLRNKDETIDELHDHILSYLRSLSLAELTQEEADEIQKYISISYWAENVADVIQHEYVDAGIFMNEEEIIVSEETELYIRNLHKKLVEFAKLTTQRIDNGILPKKEELAEEKIYFNEYLESCRKHLLDRLGKELPKRLRTFRTESNIFEATKRMHTYYRRINKML